MMNLQPSIFAQRTLATNTAVSLAHSVGRWLRGLLRHRAVPVFVLLQLPADYEQRRAPFLGRAL